MLFLGAGSSNAVGIGPLSVLTHKVIERLHDEGFSEIIDHILEIIHEKNYGHRFYQDDEIDIEVILSILNRSICHDKSLKELGPYAVYSSNENPDAILNPIQMHDMNRIRSIVSEEITNHCLDYKTEDAFNFYSSFFFLDRDIVNFRTFGSTSNKRVFSNIVTVNYDLVIEDVFDRMKSGIHRGLVQHSPEEDSYIPLEKILLNQLHPNETINYLKLHGSIDWRIRDSDNQIVKRDTDISLRRTLQLNN